MKINKIINNLYYSILLLVPVGWLLNWKYYFSRFESEGFDWVKWVVSISLVIFATVLFSVSQFLKIKRQKVWKLFFIGYVILALYSINCTAAGQYWDQQKKNQETKTEVIDKENNAYWIEQYKKDIKNAEDEIINYKKVRDSSINDMGDLYYYRNTGKTLRELITNENNKIEKARIELKKLTDENKVSAKNEKDILMSKNLYIFYKIAFKQPEGFEENIQFIFQIILSIIIEGIAQLSIFAYMKIKIMIESKEIKTEKKKNELTETELRHFAVTAYRGIVSKQGKKILPKDVILEIIKPMAGNFTEEKYDLIIRKAIKHRLFKKEKDVLIPASDFVDYNYFYRKMCEIFNFALTGM